MGSIVITQAPAYMLRMPFEGGCPHSRQFGREGMGAYHSFDGRLHRLQPGREGEGGYHSLTTVEYVFLGPFWWFSEDRPHLQQLGREGEGGYSF